MTLFKEDLDEVRCQSPGCDHKDHDDGFFLHGRCHMESGMEVQYMDGQLFVRCNTCKTQVAAVAVSSKIK